MVEVLSQCPTQAGRTLYNTREPSAMLEWLKEHTVTVTEKKPADTADSRIKIGLLHCENQPEFTETLALKRGMAQK
jgi:2-oxoglutarate ferredoxin oxidoreductase subunit beta